MTDSAILKQVDPDPVGGLTIRWWLEHSHALSFEFIGDDGEMEIEGAVKWDGCINWNTNDKCMFHFCDTADAENLTAAFRRAWALAATHLPTWDADADIELA